MGRTIPYIMESKIHVPNHQPDKNCDKLVKLVKHGDFLGSQKGQRLSGIAVVFVSLCEEMSFLEFQHAVRCLEPGRWPVLGIRPELGSYHTTFSVVLSILNVAAITVILQLI